MLPCRQHAALQRECSNRMCSDSGSSGLSPASRARPLGRMEGNLLRDSESVMASVGGYDLDLETTGQSGPRPGRTCFTAAAVRRRSDRSCKHRRLLEARLGIYNNFSM